MKLLNVYRLGSKASWCKKCVCREAVCDPLSASTAIFLYSRFKPSMFSNAKFAPSWRPLLPPRKRRGGGWGKGQRLANVSRFKPSMFISAKFAASWRPLRQPRKRWGGGRGKGQRLANVLPFSTQMGHIGAIGGEMMYGDMLHYLRNQRKNCRQNLPPTPSLDRASPPWVGTPPHQD